MAVLSVCRSLLRPSMACAINPAGKRFGGHNVMAFTPSRWHWTKFKDLLHFYTLLGLIPVTCLSLYLSVFYGDAQLADIPEGYVPEQWEYERHPVNRFIQRYLAPDPQAFYERQMYTLNQEMENVILHKISQKTFRLMADNEDYKAWYYRDFDARPYRRMRQFWQDVDIIDGNYQNFDGEPANDSSWDSGTRVRGLVSILPDAPK